MIVESIRNIWSMPDLRKRIGFTLLLLAVYRVGAVIPTPGINSEVLMRFFEQNRGTVFGFMDLFSGGNLSRFTIFALGITPYITSSIILQLLTVVWPFLEKLSKEGELGRKKITQYTRYLTVILSLVQSISIAVAFQKMPSEGSQVVINPGFGFIFMTTLTLTTGTAFIMWLGEQISERGIGNGMSLLIFAGIVTGLPHAATEIYSKLATQQWSPLVVILLLAMMVAVVGFIVLVERAQRRIPVQYAKRVVGRRVMGGQSTHLPLESERRRSYSGDLRFVHSGFPANLWLFVSGQPVLPEHVGCVAHGRAALELVIHLGHRLLLLLLHLHRVQPDRGC